VARGMAGTTAAAHTDGSAVTLFLEVHSCPRTLSVAMSRRFDPKASAFNSVVGP
jgi:hypothetical protein